MRAEIIENIKVGDACFKLTLASPDLPSEWQPGQFFMIRIGSGYDPLLRRPFSIHRMGEGHLDILYKRVGRATEALSSLTKGHGIDLLGPLGKGFTAPEGLRVALLVAGGMGVAPLVGLAQRLQQGRHRPPEISAILGARGQGDLLCAEELAEWGVTVHLCTEDGSRGRKGLATEVLTELLAGFPGPSPVPTLYACGPRPMLALTARMAAQANIPCQVSLEEYMACGIGACMGCAVPTRITGSPYQMVCKEGPVFDAEVIQW